MKNKSLFLIAPLVLLVALIGAVSASADPIMVNTGDRVVFNGQIDGHSTAGGAFSFTDIDGEDGPFTFYTYCLEWNEHLYKGKTYYAVVNTGSVNGGIGGAIDNFDPLDPATALVYRAYLLGYLSDYSQQDIQDAIWYLENEKSEGAISDTALDLADEALEYTEDSEDLGGVWALNLYKNSDYTGNAQDVLFYSPIPEPSTILLLGAGLAGIGMIARKRAKK